MEPTQDEDKRVIQFIYKDMEKINSLSAQLFQGLLRSVDKISEQGTATSTSVAGGAVVLQGSYDASGSTRESIQTQRDPHDQLIIDLMDMMQLEPHKSLPQRVQGSIALLQGSILLRDLDAMKAVAQKILGNNKAIPEIKLDAKVQKQLKLMFDILPSGLEMELTVGGKQVRGPLEPKWLLSRQEDLMRTYGLRMPGEWQVLGFLDSLNEAKSKITATEDMRGALDELTAAINGLMHSIGPSHAFHPIMIFRELHFS